MYQKIRAPISLARARAALPAKTAQMTGVKAEMVIGQIFRANIDYAGVQGVDCIVMGPYKPGFSDDLLGFTAACVLRRARLPQHLTQAYAQKSYPIRKASLL